MILPHHIIILLFHFLFSSISTIQNTAVAKPQTGFNTAIIILRQILSTIQQKRVYSSDSFIPSSTSAAIHPSHTIPATSTINPFPTPTCIAATTTIRLYTARKFTPHCIHVRKTCSNSVFFFSFMEKSYHIRNRVGGISLK